jgi:hypothetical protein
MKYANLYSQGVGSAQASANQAYDVSQRNLDLKNIAGGISGVIGLKQSQSAYENLAGDSGVLTKQIENYRQLLGQGGLDEVQQADLQAKLSSLELLKGGLNINNIGEFSKMYKEFLSPVDQLGLAKASLNADAMAGYRMGMLALMQDRLAIDKPLKDAQAAKAAAETEGLQRKNEFVTGFTNKESNPSGLIKMGATLLGL